MQALFNRKLADFAADLQHLNSGLSRPVPQLAMLPTGVQVMTVVDPGAPLRLFRRHVLQHQRAILERDDKFFLEAPSLDASMDAKDLDLVAILRSVWCTLGPANKEAIWGHMQVLLTLERKIREVEGGGGGA